uniref:Uncharacterized protein n=1 Tax=viral metagenome TaxID=1070528 RepID=A0A6M3LHE0_9ZZZZ
MKANTDHFTISENNAYKAGIREVVGWVNDHLHKSPSCSYDFCFGGRTWKAQKKKWGV